MSLRPVGDWSESAVTQFVSAYHQHTHSADLAGRSTESIAAAAVSHAELGAHRSVGQVLVRAITPLGARHSVVQVVMDDMPFLVDSLTSVLSRTGRGVHRVVHPILFVERDASGHLTEVHADNVESAIAESWTEFEINRLLTDAEHQSVEADVASVLQQVAAVTTDWAKMREKCSELAQQWTEATPPGVSTSDANETRDLLRWLADNHLTFLGYRYYTLDVQQARLDSVDDTGLGLLHGRAASHRDFSVLPEIAREALLSSKPLVLTKSSQKSSVHRHVYMDYFGIKQFDSAGAVIGEHRFLGLLSRDAYSDSVLTIPVMRLVAQGVLDAAKAMPGSHSYRDMLQFLEAFPRDEMLQVDSQWLSATTASALAGQNRRDTQVFFHADLWGRFVNAFVYLPRDVYNTSVRHKIERLLSANLPTAEIDSAVLLGDSNLARVHFRVKLSERVDFARLELDSLASQIEAQTQSWHDHLAESVVLESDSDASAASTLETWRDAFSEAYVATYSVDTAVADLRAVESAPATAVRLAEADGSTHVRIFNAEQALKLSTLLPVLSAFGLDVIDEQPYLLHPHGRPEIWLHDLHFEFTVSPHDGWEERFTSALLESLRQRVETDPLLQLVVVSKLTGRDVAILRTYASYVAQWLPYGVTTVHAALIANPGVCERLIDLFRARFDVVDPAREQSALQALEPLLDAVASLEHDRVLRAVHASLLATVRTNAMRIDADGELKTTISLKLRAAEIPMLPQPHPFAEIWLDGPMVHGVHLRFGAVARGGLRWSDRRDDLRTEVMGLVRAQVVKNAVIVPTGAKGGFFPKQLPDSSNREAWLAAGVAAYQLYINALLDVTDNYVPGGIEKPTNVICRDEDDPYLVVAADKGTATFSDIANEVSLTRGFWLGDAFASGGSVGYDHKAMGITARGAWESVVHHGLLRNLDVQKDPATIVGIGDMSGDVFGNGLLRSESVLLIAAFDHRHIFIDPQPDARKSFVERSRLFALPRSSWQDFDATVISAGGGVYSRADKRIELSQVAAAALGIESESLLMTPAELITHILKAPVDILWNGGIGTYIKATTESHADVGDRANDAIRINANELRCAIVGEGGNLGLTQRGRIEAALHGVALNTDAIDNSAGVDTSDHEVNLKILLSLRPHLAAEDRNALLKSMTDDVAQLVLADNIAQNEVLSLAAAQAHSMLSVHSRLIENWQSRGLINRTLEALPDAAEIERRSAAGIGLTRPELSVLLAHAKLQLTHDLLQGTAIDGDWAHAWLRSYFPASLVGEWDSEISQHPLRREIIATVLANRVINRAGITAVYRLTEETGVDSELAALALLSAMSVTGLDELSTQLWSSGASWPARIACGLEARRYVDRVARWLIAHRGTPAQIVSNLERLRAVAHEVRLLVPVHLQGGERGRWLASAERFADLGMDSALAGMFAGLLDEYAALDFGDGPADPTITTEKWSALYFELSELVGGDAILNAISALPRHDRWQTMARAAMRADMYAVLAALASQVLKMSAETRVSDWSAAQASGLARVRSVVAEISAAPADLAAISVALRMLRELVAQSS